MSAKGRARKLRGAWYTPPALALEIVEHALEPVLARTKRGDSPVRVVDPACGEGAFLAAALDVLARWYAAHESREGREAIARRHLFGCEMDDRAAASARAMGANVVTGDALLGVAWERAFPEAMASGGFDVVVGNPPYVESALLVRKRRAWRERVAKAYEAARGNWDLFCPFVELAIDLAKEGGTIGLLVPNKIAAADYATALRALVARRTDVTWKRDCAADGAFDAAVYPIALVATRRAAKDEGQARAAESGAPWRMAAGTAAHAVYELQGEPLGDLAEVTGAATVAEAYAMRELVGEIDPGDDGAIKLVNSGTIDRYALRWGVQPCRYLSRSLVRPAIASRDLERLPPRRLAQARAPKIVVAGLTKRLECALDAVGQVLAGKSTCVIAGARVDLRFLVAVLNSAPITEWFRAVYGGNALAGGYLRIGPRQIAAIPIALGDEGARARIAALADARMASKPGEARRAIEASIDREVSALYGLREG